VPPTALVDTDLPDEEILESAAENMAGNMDYIDPEDFLDNLDPNDKYEASMQLMLEGETFSERFGIFGIPALDDMDEEQREDVIKIAVLDYIIGNTDRHCGNIFLTEEGRVAAIDNGLAFPDPNVEMGGRGNQFKSVAVRMASGEPVPDDILRKMDSVKEEDFKEALGHYHMYDEAESAWERLTDILSVGEVITR